MSQAEDMARKLSVRTKEMARAQDRAEAAHNKLENVTEQLRKADIKVELVFNYCGEIFILFVDFSRWQVCSLISRTDLGWTTSTRNRF